MGARNRQRPSWIRGRDAIKILNGLYPRSPRTPQSSSMIRGAAKASWKLGEIPRIVTTVSTIVTADSKKNGGIGHVRLEWPVTIRWNERSRSFGIGGHVGVEYATSASMACASSCLAPSFSSSPSASSAGAFSSTTLLSFIAVYVSCWLLIRKDQSTGYSASSVSPYTRNQHSSIFGRLGCKKPPNGSSPWSLAIPGPGRSPSAPMTTWAGRVSAGRQRAPAQDGPQNGGSCWRWIAAADGSGDAAGR